MTLEGKSLKAVVDDLQRQETDVLVELEYDRKRGSSATATKRFKLVGLLNRDTGEYHLWVTNLPQSDYPAHDIAQLYRARWDVELLFKELKSRFRFDEINMTKPYVIEALIIMAAIPVMISRVIIDEFHDLEARRRGAADVDESASRLTGHRTPRPSGSVVPDAGSRLRTARSGRVVAVGIAGSEPIQGTATQSS